MSEPSSRTPSETPTNNESEAGTAAKSDAQSQALRTCHGCGRLLVLDATPDRKGTYWWRLGAGGPPHDEVRCMTAHGPSNGASSYRTDGSVGRIPKSLPNARGLPKQKRAEAVEHRKAVMAELGVVVPKVR